VSGGGESPFVIVRTGFRRPLGDALCWHVAPEFRETFEPWLRRHWPRLLNTPSALLKSDPAGRVAEAEGFVLKEYRKQRGVLAFGHPSAARRAFNYARHLIQHKLPLPAPVAWCVRRRFGFLIREYLVTRMVPNAIPLNRWMAATERTPETTAAILRQWGRLLGQFHNHGYTHRDLKDENLLVTEGPEGPRLIPVDLDGVTLSRAARVVRLRRDFWPLLRSLLFLRCYHPDAVQRMIEGYNDVAEQPITAADLPRVLWPDPPSEEGWSGVRLLIMRSGFHREVLHIRVRNRPSVPWADLFLFWVHRLPTLRPMRHSSRVQTAVGSWPELGIECLFKRYPAPRGWLQWRQTLGAPSPARRSLATLTRLRALGLKVPDVLAYLECWAGLRPMGSALITRTVSGMPLDQWLQQPLPADQRAAVAEALVRDLATIHRAGFLVSDLRLSHWQVILDGMTHRLEVVWVEADNLVRFGSDREALNQLADLAVQAAQGLTPGEGRRLWRSYEKARAWTGPYAQGRRRWLFAALRRLRVMPPAA